MIKIFDKDDCEFGVIIYEGPTKYITQIIEPRLYENYKVQLEKAPYSKFRSQVAIEFQSKGYTVLIKN